MKKQEEFIHHLQTSIEKRRQSIKEWVEMFLWYKERAAHYYNINLVETYQDNINHMNDAKEHLKHLHKAQKTEMEMLKWIKEK